MHAVEIQAVAVDGIHMLRPSNQSDGSAGPGQHAAKIAANRAGPYNRNPL